MEQNPGLPFLHERDLELEIVHLFVLEHTWIYSTGTWPPCWPQAERTRSRPQRPI